MKVRRLVALLWAALILSVLDNRPAFACSGGSPLTIRGALNQADYTVYASVMETDDLKQNVIVRIENYLTGGAGSEYLLIKRDDPTFFTYMQAGRSSGGDCLSLHPGLSPRDTFYAFIQRNIDGSYSLISTLFNSPYFDFESDVSTVEVFLEGLQDNENYAERGSGKQVTEVEFVDIIAEESGESSISPNPGSPYPLYAPLWILTDGFPNRQYMLPVDFGELVPLDYETTNISNHPLWSFGFSDAGTCPYEYCIQISPDNLNIAVQIDANTIQFTWGHSVEGQIARFSSTSDTVAVWNVCDLTIYTTGYPRLGQAWYELEQLNSTRINANNEEDCAAFAGKGVWSPNGRIFAYTDSKGLWWWDVYTNLPPYRLLESANNNVPIARYFSPLGRYLAVSVDAVSFTLDTTTGERLPDGIVSPDDRLLLSFDTLAYPASLEICSLTPFSCQPARGMYIETFNAAGERQSLTETDRVAQVTWTGRSTFVARGCVPDDPRTCSIFQWGPPTAFGGWQFPTYVSQGYNFDFDEANHQIAVVSDKSNITVEGHTVELAGQIDGSILYVQWMPSLFYRE